MLLDGSLVRILFEDSSAEARSSRPTSLIFRGDSVESLPISLLKAHLGCRQLFWPLHAPPDSLVLEAPTTSPVLDRVCWG